MIYTIHPHPHIANKLFDLLMLAFFFLTWITGLASSLRVKLYLGIGVSIFRVSVHPGDPWEVLEWHLWACHVSGVSPLGVQWVFHLDRYIHNLWTCVVYRGFPGGSGGEESPCSVGELGLIPGLGRSPGEEDGTHSSILAWGIPWTVYRLYIRSLLFLSLWLCWVFVAAHRLFIVVCGLLSSCRVPKFSSCSSRASLIAAHRLSCPTAPGILLPRLGIEPMSPELKGRS